MPRIRCRYIDCYFLESGYCTAEIIRLDPDEGCLTYSHIDDVTLSEPEDWELDEIEDLDDIDEIDEIDEVWEDNGDDDEEDDDGVEDWIEDDVL
jgi:hypothetical protein